MADYNDVFATSGQEILYGTAGNDRFVFEPGTSTSTAIDVIYDWQPGDIIDLSALGLTLADLETRLISGGNTLKLIQGFGADDFQLKINLNGHAMQDVLDSLVFDAPPQPNTPAVANWDVFYAVEGTVAIFDPLANDFDSDGDVLSIVQINGEDVVVGDTVHTWIGDVTLNADMTLSYNVTANTGGYNQSDYLDLTISDGTVQSYSNAGIWVTPSSYAPQANPDDLTGVIGTEIVLDVLANDSDPENDPLHITSVGGLPIQVGETVQLAYGSGTVTLNADQTLTYVSAANNNGYPFYDYFEYSVSDGHGESASYVWVELDPLNYAPQANYDYVRGVVGTEMVLDVLANDTDPEGDPLHITSVGGVSIEVGETVELSGGIGTATLNADQTLTIVSTAPDSGHTVYQRIFYGVSDGNAVSYADVELQLDPQNFAPEANPDYFTGVNGTEMVLDVLANDSDPEGDALHITSVGGVPIQVGETVQLSESYGSGYGAITLNADQTLTYASTTTDSGYPVGQYVDYTVSDGHAESSSYALLQLDPQNYAPQANYDNLNGVIGTEMVLDVLANDTDPEGDLLHITSVDGVSIEVGETVALSYGMGTVTLNADQTLTYVSTTTDSGYAVYGYFEYGVSDGIAESRGEVELRLDPQNFAPYAGWGIADVEFGVPVTIDLLANASDPENDPLTITEIGEQAISVGETLQTQWGAVTLNEDQTITLVPDLPRTTNGTSGSLSYSASDGHSSSAGTFYLYQASSTPPDFLVSFNITDDREMVFDDARGLLYVATGSGQVLRYNVATQTLLAPIETGANPGGLSLSPDGTTLFVADLNYSSSPLEAAVIRVDLETLAVERLLYSDFGGGGSFDLAVDANNYLMVSNQFPGSGWTSVNYFDAFSTTLNQISNPFADGNWRQDTTLDASRDGQFVLIVESNISDVPFSIYSAEAQGIIASSDLYAFGSSGFNNGGNAISSEAGLVALAHGPILDFSLNLVEGLSATVSNYNVSEYEFSAGGHYLFAWVLEELYAFDTQTSEVAGRLFVGATRISDYALSYFDNMVTSADGRYLTLNGNSAGTSEVIIIDLQQAFGFIDPSSTPPPTLYNDIIATTSFDLLSGTDAADRFVFAPGTSTSSAIDIVANWQPGDVIDLSALGLTLADLETRLISGGATLKLIEGFGANDFQLKINLNGYSVQDVLVSLLFDSDRAPPTAVADTAETAFQTPIVIDVLSNDLDPDNAGLAVIELLGEPVAPGESIASPFGFQIGLNADGTLTFVPDDAHVGTSHITYTLEGGSVGDLTVTVTPPDGDIAGDSSTTATLAGGETLLSALEFRSDRDWIAVELTAGQTYVFETQGTGDRPLTEPVTALFDDGGQVASESAAGSSISRVVFTPATSGTYYLEVMGAGNFAIGDYHVSFDAQASGPIVIEGTEGPDHLSGVDGDEIINALGGDDIIIASSSGMDEINGGEGWDTVVYGSSNAFLAEPIYVNLIEGHAYQDGFLGEDLLTGIENAEISSTLDDLLVGDDNDNRLVLYGGGGDEVHGLGGNDDIWIDQAPTLIDGGSGTDRLSFLADRMFATTDASGPIFGFEGRTLGVTVDLSAGLIVDDGYGGSGTIVGIENIKGTSFSDNVIGDDGDNSITALRGQDTIDGRGGGDTLQGGDGNDLLFGGEGNDSLQGQNDDDWLAGGSGEDSLFGGAGNDTFATVDGIREFAGDVIWDMEVGERLDIADGNAADGIESYIFIGEDAFSGTAGEVQVQLFANAIGLNWDMDGDGESDQTMSIYAPAGTTLDLVSQETGHLVLELVSASVSVYNDINFTAGVAEQSAGTDGADRYIFEPGDSTSSSLDFLTGWDAQDAIDLSALGLTLDDLEVRLVGGGTIMKLIQGFGADDFQLKISLNGHTVQDVLDSIIFADPPVAEVQDTVGKATTLAAEDTFDFDSLTTPVQDTSPFVDAFDIGLNTELAMTVAAVDTWTDPLTGFAQLGADAAPDDILHDFLLMGHHY
ncbi:MAG: cadherin-like domain-containing protein [Hyphomonas sp.]|nr:cadherin-like domain-containing protein [Hyphomonas sp.]